MKKMYWIVLVILTVLLANGCERAENTGAFKQEKGGVHPELLKDRDALLKLASRIDDFIGFTYTDQELKDREGQTDYRSVLETFVKRNLKDDVETFQTVSKTVNPKWLIVTTKNERVYYLSMQKWHNYGGIWTVGSVAEFQAVEYPVKRAFQLVEEEEIEGIGEGFREWFEREMAQPGWSTAYTRVDGKTYALVKSTASASDSVELDDVTIFQGMMEVQYQTFDYLNVPPLTEPSLNDYILVRIDMAGADIPVSFVETYTNVK